MRCSDCGGQIEPGWAVCGWCGHSTDPEDAVVTAEVTPRSDSEADPEPPSPEVPGDGEAMALGSGTLLLARYRIDAILGRGGFGITYRTRDTRLHRDVAIKELFPPGAIRQGGLVTVVESDRAAFAEARARFQREAATLARFNHPGIVQIFEVFEANQTAYLVMELIEGPSVGQLLQRHGEPFTVDEVLDVVLRAGGALGAVHEAGLLHRDINPSNIMVDGSRRVVLIDFGLARAYGDGNSGNVTRAVTPGYAPPEQYAGSARSGPPCDVFGLAATAYKLLTGITPTNVFDRQAGDVVTPPHQVRPGVSPVVSAAILDGMELDPGHRPATTQAFLNRLGLFGFVPESEVLLGSGEVDRERGADPVVPPVLSPPPVVAPPHVAPALPAPEGPADVIRAPGPVPAPAQLPPRGPAPVAFAPWHDGAPPVVGPAARWRGWVTWPASIAAVALASASPLPIAVAIAYVIIPLLATAGDVQVHRHRRRTGAVQRRWDNAGSAVVVPARFLRNLAVAVARSLPAVAVAAIGIATEGVLADGAVEPILRDVTIRATGIAMALVLLLPIRHGGRGFRTDLGITAVATWVMEGRQRPGARTIATWVVALALTAFGAWLQPELWPLT